MLRLAAALALFGLVPASAAHGAGLPTMPLGDVRSGMACTARSVVLGTTVVDFDARVDEVISGGTDPAGARLLLTVSGPAVDATGVGPGFSGSPVLCPGADGVLRVAGAISETIGAFGGKTVLATPIQAVLRESVDPPRATVTGVRAASLRRRARPISQALSYSGLSPAVGRVFQRAAARAGRTLVLAPLRPAQAPAPPPAIVPGSAIGVTLATGDLDAGAIGTAAYVDGTTVWGFGHPFDAAGRRSLFLTAAHVYAVVGNPLATQEAATYKLAAPTATIGTVTQDGVSAVVGRLGAGPPGFPVRVSVRDLDTRRLRGLNVRVADERALGLPTGASALSAIAPAAIVEGIFGTLSGSPVRQSGEMCLRVTARGRAKPIGFCNTYVGGGRQPRRARGRADRRGRRRRDPDPRRLRRGAADGDAGRDRPADRARAAALDAAQPQRAARRAAREHDQRPRDAAASRGRRHAPHDPGGDPARDAGRAARPLPQGDRGRRRAGRGRR